MASFLCSLSLALYREGSSFPTLLTHSVILSCFGQCNQSESASLDFHAEVLELAGDLLCTFASAMMTSHNSDRSSSIRLGLGVRTICSGGMGQPNCSHQLEIILCCCERLRFGGGRLLLQHNLSHPDHYNFQKCS